MAPLPDPTPVTRAVRAMAWLLRLYPADFREVYAADMGLTFRAQCRVAYAHRGLLGLASLWLITALNITWEAARERTQSSARVGALAWIIGGGMWALIHSPLMLRAFAHPIIALLLLIVGLASLLAQVAPFVRRITLLGFLITGLGQISILAGYCAALFRLWEQNGIPVLIGTALQCIGLVMLALTLIGIQPPTDSSCRRGLWQWLMLVLAMLLIIHALIAFMPLRSEGMLYSPVYMLGIAIMGMLIGVCWALLGAALWRAARTDEIGLIS